MSDRIEHNPTPVSGVSENSEISFEALRYALSLVRRARSVMNAAEFENCLSQSEVSFHLGCAEIALMRLVLEEEREFSDGDAP